MIWGILYLIVYVAICSFAFYKAVEKYYSEPHNPNDYYTPKEKMNNFMFYFSMMMWFWPITLVPCFVYLKAIEKFANK